MPALSEASSERGEGLFGDLAPRRCPVCDSASAGDVFAEQAVDAAALDGFAFASRKRPERMRLRLVTCPDCDLVFANPAPDPVLLAAAYEAAAFDTGEEAAFAARTYAESLAPLVDRLPDRDGALDIGTGDGAFLGELIDLGFTGVVGVEPSAEPIAGAAARVAGMIRQDVFRAGLLPQRSLSLVTCFQTIEHVTDPAALVAGALALLKPGGVLAIVCHDRRALVNRALGKRSPIMDIEHMQLFSPASLAGLLERSGLCDVDCRPIRNRYPLRYWTRLAPLPNAAHDVAQRLLRRTGLGDLPVTVPVGNLLGWGTRP
jgi:SAM-dependent methyltransferase